MSLINRLVGLVNGDVEPVSGLEIHFISVCKGEARALSPEEKKWYELYLNRDSIAASDKTTIFSQADSSALTQQARPDSDSLLISSLRADLQVLSQKVRSQHSSIQSLEKLNKSLTNIIDSSNNVVSKDTELSNKVIQLKGELSEKNDEIFQLTRRVNNLKDENSRINIEKNDLANKIDIITANIEETVKKEIIRGNQELYDRERSLSGKIDMYKSNIQKLMELLVSLVPAKIKCPECDGLPNWTDRADSKVKCNTLGFNG